MANCQTRTSKRATGQKINYSKSVVLRINNPTWFPISKPFQIMSPSDVQNFLGLEIGGNVDYTFFWNERKDKLCSAYDFHLRNKYSIFGRVVLARTYTVSKLWYSAMFHTPSDAWLKKYRK